MRSHYPFITDEQFETLLSNGRLALPYQEKGQDFDPLPVVKLHARCGRDLAADGNRS
jgi:hypothetical protein